MARGGIGFRVCGRFRIFRQRWLRQFKPRDEPHRLRCPLAIGLHDQSLMLIQPPQRTDGADGHFDLERAIALREQAAFGPPGVAPGPDPVAAHTHGHVGEHGRLRLAAAHEHHVVEIVQRGPPADRPQPLRQTFQPLDRGDDKTAFAPDGGQLFDVLFRDHQRELIGDHAANPVGRLLPQLHRVEKILLGQSEEQFRQPRFPQGLDRDDANLAGRRRFRI